LEFRRLSSGAAFRSVGKVAAALGLAAALLACPAWLRFGSVGLIAVFVGAGVCLLPSVILAIRSPSAAGPQRVVQMVLVGTLVRIGAVSGAGLLLTSWKPVFRTVEFFLGLALFYGVALVVETRELLAEIARDSAPPATPTESSPTQR